MSERPSPPEPFGDDHLVDLYRLAHRAALGLLRDRDLAADAAGDAVTTLLVRRGRLRDHPNLEGWIVLTARRRATDLLRRELRRPAKELAAVVARRAAPTSVAALGLGAGLGTGTGTADERLDVLALLSALPPRQRTAAYLTWVADLDEAAVAEALGVSAGTVKRHLSRARATVRSAVLATAPDLGPGPEPALPVGPAPFGRRVGERSGSAGVGVAGPSDEAEERGD